MIKSSNSTKCCINIIFIFGCHLIRGIACRFRKAKLQTLAREFLGQEIQNSKAGHCSVEDSAATMKLVKLKLANSVNYGDAVLDHYTSHIQTVETNKLSSEHKAEGKTYAMSIFNHVTKNKDTTVAIVGRQEIMSEYTRYLSSSSLNIMDDENFMKGDQVSMPMCLRTIL